MYVQMIDIYIEKIIKNIKNIEKKSDIFNFSIFSKLSHYFPTLSNVLCTLVEREKKSFQIMTKTVKRLFTYLYHIALPHHYPFSDVN